jgi:hypothetical protein
MKSDVNGCSTCQAATENIEQFRSTLNKKMMIDYDYRTPAGKLFSCIAKTLDEARAKRDEWLKTI